MNLSARIQLSILVLSAATFLASYFAIDIFSPKEKEHGILATVMGGSIVIFFFQLVAIVLELIWIN